MRNHDADAPLRDDEAWRERSILPPEPAMRVTQTFGRPEPVAQPAPQPAPRRFGIADLKKLFGGKKLTPATIDDKISASLGEIETAEALLRDASAKLARPGPLSDVEHAQAEADAAAARRAIVRHKDLIQGFEAEREVVAAAEAKVAFLKHVEAARTRAAEASTRLAAEYEPAAKLIASILADVRASQDEIAELMRQGREFGETVEIESPLVTRGLPDADVSLAVLLQRSDLLTDVSLPGLLFSDPDIVTPDRAALARRWANLA